MRVRHSMMISNNEPPYNLIVKEEECKCNLNAECRMYEEDVKMIVSFEQTV